MPLRLLSISLLLLLGACATTTQHRRPAAPAPSSAPAAPAAGVKIGKPYVVFGKTYVPADDRAYDQTGIASWYGPDFHTKPTANGEIYNQDDVTAAHKTLPMPSWVEVHNLDNGRKLTVRVNDRGPFVDGRIIDLSRRSAQLLGVDRPGLARVRVRRVFPEGDWARATPALPVSTMPQAPPQAAPQMAQVTPAPSPAPPLPAPSSPAPSSPSPVVTAPAPSPVLVATAPAVAAGRYIQIAALSDEARARALASVMADFGPAAATPSGTGLWRVRIGPVAAAQVTNILYEVHAGGWPDARIVAP